MKKVLMLILAVMLVFTACGKKNDKKTENKADNTKIVQQENKTSEEKQSDAKQEESKPVNQGEAVPIDGEEFGDLLKDYESAKNSGDEKAERAALDEIQKILENVEAQSAE